MCHAAPRRNLEGVNESAFVHAGSWIKSRLGDSKVNKGGLIMMSLNEWLAVLRDLKSGIVFPLGVGGLMLMLFGWRLWKVCVGLSFAIVGAGLFTYLADIQRTDVDPFYLIVISLVLGVLAFRFARIGLPALGGVILMGITASIVSSAKVDGPVVWALSATGFVCGCALAFINRRYLVISITGLLGSVLFVSGFVAFLMTMPSTYTTFHGMAMGSSVVIPFMILVPMVMSFFYQVSEVRRVQAEL